MSAQLLTNPNGTREVVLYGFTATDFGKQDAVTKSREYLKDSTISVSNRIKVRPELENQPATPAAPTASANAGTGDDYSGQIGRPEASTQPADADSGMQKQSRRDIQSYEDQQQQVNQQQAAMGGMGGGPGMTFGGNGMSMSMGGSGMGVLLGLLGGAGGSSPLLGLLGNAGGFGPSGYGYGAPSGYSPPSYGYSNYGPPPYGAPGYSSGGYPPGGGNPYPY